MAMKKSDLLNPKQMVEAKGGYAELQPVASGPTAAVPADTDAVTECGVDCERELAASKTPASKTPASKTRRAGRGPARRSTTRR